MFFLENMSKLQLRRYSLTRPVFELYSAFMVGNIQDFENGKRLRSWGMLLSVVFYRLSSETSCQGQNTAFKSIAFVISPLLS